MTHVLQYVYVFFVLLSAFVLKNSQKKKKNSRGFMLLTDESHHRTLLFFQQGQLDHDALKKVPECNRYQRCCAAFPRGADVDDNTPSSCSCCGGGAGISDTIITTCHKEEWKPYYFYKPGFILTQFFGYFLDPTCSTKDPPPCSGRRTRRANYYSNSTIIISERHHSPSRRIHSPRGSRRNCCHLRDGSA